MLLAAGKPAISAGSKTTNSNWSVSRMRFLMARLRNSLSVVKVRALTWMVPTRAVDRSAGSTEICPPHLVRGANHGLGRTAQHFVDQKACLRLGRHDLKDGRSGRRLLTRLCHLFHRFRCPFGKATSSLAGKEVAAVWSPSVGRATLVASSCEGTCCSGSVAMGTASIGPDATSGTLRNE